MFVGTMFLMVPIFLPLLVCPWRVRKPIMTKIVRIWGRLGLAIAGVRLEVTGKQWLSQARPRVVVLNHSSVLDMLVMAAVSPPRMVGVSKKELRWFFPINLAFFLVGVVFVDRSSPAAAVEDLRKVALRVGQESLAVMLAPEGTRTRTGELGHFKSGAFHLAQQAGAEIVPVVIHNAFELCPPTGWRVRSGVVRVEIQKPWSPLPLEGEPRQQAAELEEQYRQWLGR